MNIEVRKADICDAKMISVIGKISFRNAFGNVFDKDNLDDYIKNVYNPDKIAVSIERNNDIFLVAEIGNRPVGFAKLKKFSLNDDIESCSQMQLEKIYVLPEYQGIGAGTTLLREVIGIVKALCPDYLWLDVYSGNEKAIRFYERNGFKKGNTFHQGFGDRFFEFQMMLLPVYSEETMYCH
jgi:ribosomal protein S18 acetylase RimI-like enzyme